MARRADLRWVQGLSPGQALLAAARPDVIHGQRLPWFGSAFYLYMAAAVLFAVAVNLWAMAPRAGLEPVARARPQLEESDEFRVQGAGDSVQEAEGGALTPALSKRERGKSVHAAAGEARHVWDNPVLWREICTWAYGKKVIAVRVAYLLLFAATAWGVYAASQKRSGNQDGLAVGCVTASGVEFGISECLGGDVDYLGGRHLGALDLLLVTDITPLEFILGKLGGVFYVAKEVVALPLALCVYLWWSGAISLEILVYLVGGLLLMDLFVATLGIHAGLAYTNSRMRWR